MAKAMHRSIADELIDANALKPGQALLVAIWIAFFSHMVFSAFVP